MTRTHRIALLLAGSALIAGAQAASADVRISVGGGIRIGGGPIRAHWVHRHVHRPAVHVGGSIWIGGGGYYQPFAQPPPPPPPPMGCNCEQPQTYYPIAPAPVGYATVAAPAPAPAPLSRFGIGVFMGGVSVDGEHDGQDRCKGGEWNERHQRSQAQHAGKQEHGVQHAGDRRPAARPDVGGGACDSARGA